MNITALVPMRHDSERVPGKNYRPLGGIPLFHHILNALLAVPQIDRIVVDTDSPTISDSCASHFPGVVCIERPDHLRDGHIPMTEVLKHDVELFPSEWYLQTHSTNPFLTGSTIARALQDLSESRDRFDSVVSVSRIQGRLFQADGTPLNHDPEVLLRTQDLEPIFLENSNLYVFTGDQVAAGKRFGASPLFFEIEPWEALDIDIEAEFAIADALIKGGGRPS